MGFEPTRAERIGSAVHRLNHIGHLFTSSNYRERLENGQGKDVSYLKGFLCPRQE